MILRTFLEKKKGQPLIFIVQKPQLKLELFLQVTVHNFYIYYTQLTVLIL